MRPLRVFTWHVHGSYLLYLSQIPHEIYVPVQPGRPAGYGGLGGPFPWPSTIHEVPVEEIPRLTLDCVLFQQRDQYLKDQYEILSPEQRRLPQLYLEHDPPRESPTDTRHPVDDPNVLLVHVTHFNRLMWDSGRTPTRVVEHGVMAPEHVRYSGELARGVVVINHLARRGRRLGVDIFEQARQSAPLDLLGMAADECGGVGEIPHNQIPEHVARYRFFFNPIRYTSLGLAVLEAMMLGAPILGLATTEMVTTIENDVSGYLHTDLARVVGRMRDLLADPTEARRLGEGARRVALERFNIERFVRDWDATLREATATTRSRAGTSRSSSQTPLHSGAGEPLVNRRIALISEHASPLGALGGVDSGGQNVYVGHVARQLAARGWEVDVFTRRDAPDLPEVVDWQPGVRVIHVTAGPAAFVPKEAMLPYMPDFTVAVIAMAHERAYVLLHANFWMSGSVAAEVKQTLGIPFVVTFHALGKVRRLHQGEDDRSPPERIDIETRVVREADAIIAECPADDADLVTLYGATPAKVTVVPCGFDPAEMAPVDRRVARLALGLPLDEPIVLQLGRMVPRKGVDTVIEAFSRLVHQHGWTRGALLVVGGESDAPDPGLTPEIGRLTALAESLGIRERVRFLGRRKREELRAYYCAADVFVTTPWYEPFGITPLEAMACGTPVVGSSVGGIRFSVLDGETGFLAPPRDPAAIAERVAQVVSDPELRERMSVQAVARAERLFTWEKVAAQIETVYLSTLRTSAPSTPSAWPAQVAAVDPTSAPAATADPAIMEGFAGAIAVLQASQRVLGPAILEVAEKLKACFERGGKLLICGNGGSAAEAQHFAAEFVGRLQPPARAALPAIALAADSVTLTAWANDAGFDGVFARQVAAFGQPDDMLLVLSTSGRSRNVVLALQEAERRGVQTVALLGGDGGEARGSAQTVLLIPSADTQHIQEAQQVILHILAGLVDRAWQSCTQALPVTAQHVPADPRPVKRTSVDLAPTMPVRPGLTAQGASSPAPGELGPRDPASQERSPRELSTAANGAGAVGGRS